MKCLVSHVLAVSQFFRLLCQTPLLSVLFVFLYIGEVILSS
jgi:hypothetical protein